MIGVDWIGGPDRRYHATVDGSTACGAELGGVAIADHPCETCVEIIFAAIAAIPGLDAEDE